MGKRRRTSGGPIDYSKEYQQKHERKKLFDKEEGRRRALISSMRAAATDMVETGTIKSVELRTITSTVSTVCVGLLTGQYIEIYISSSVTEVYCPGVVDICSRIITVVIGPKDEMSIEDLTRLLVRNIRRRCRGFWLEHCALQVLEKYIEHETNDFLLAARRANGYLEDKVQKKDFVLTCQKDGIEFEVSFDIKNNIEAVLKARDHNYPHATMDSSIYELERHPSKFIERVRRLKDVVFKKNRGMLVPNRELHISSIDH